MAPRDDYPVLYVDDDPANLETTQYVLGDAFDLECCTDPNDALQRLAEREYSVLLSDQRMPGMTGVELCRRALEVRPETPRIILSAHADTSVVMDAINVGAVSRFLAKPFRADLLAGALRDAIETHRRNRARRELEDHMLRAAPGLAVRGVHAEIGQELSALIEPLLSSMARAEASLAKDDDGSTRSRRALDQHADLTAGAAAIRSFAARLMMGQRPPGQGRTNLAGAVDSTLRVLRSAIERVAPIDVLVSETPDVTLEPAALSHVLLQAITLAMTGAESHPGGRLSLLVSMSDGSAELQIRYRTAQDTQHSVTLPVAADSARLRTLRHILEESGGSIRRDPGAAFTLSFPVTR